MNHEHGRAPSPLPRRSWWRRNWRLLLGLGLSAICLYLALRGISLERLQAAAAAARWAWVIPAVGVVLAGTVLKAMRWRALFFPEKPGLARVWSVFMIGQMLNVVLPGRAGELSRIYFIGEVDEVSRARALSTVVTEKMVDLSMLAGAYLAVGIWLSMTPIGLPDWLREAGAILLPIATLALAGCLTLAYLGRRVWGYVRRLVNPLSLAWTASVDRAIEQAISGFEALRHWPTSAVVWTLSLLIWTLATLTNFLLFQAFQLPLSPYAALLLLVVLMTGVAVPPLPGNLGVMPYLCQLVLSVLGVDRETALLYGVVLQLVVNLPSILLGSGCLVWENWFAQRRNRHTDGHPSIAVPETEMQ